MPDGRARNAVAEREAADVGALRRPRRRLVASVRLFFWRLFGARRRRTPRGWIGSEGSAGKLSARRVLRYPQIDTGPRRSPSACSETLAKKTDSSLLCSWTRCSPRPAPAGASPRGKKKPASRDGDQDGHPHEPHHHHHHHHHQDRRGADGRWWDRKSLRNFALPSLTNSHPVLARTGPRHYNILVIII